MSLILNAYIVISGLLLFGFCLVPAAWKLMYAKVMGHSIILHFGDNKRLKILPVKWNGKHFEKKKGKYQWIPSETYFLDNMTVAMAQGSSAYIVSGALAKITEELKSLNITNIKTLQSHVDKGESIELYDGNLVYDDKLKGFVMKWRTFSFKDIFSFIQKSTSYNHIWQQTQHQKAIDIANMIKKDPIYWMAIGGSLFLVLIGAAFAYNYLNIPLMKEESFRTGYNNCINAVREGTQLAEIAAENSKQDHKVYS